MNASLRRFAAGTWLALSLAMPLPAATAGNATAGTRDDADHFDATVGFIGAIVGAVIGVAGTIAGSWYTDRIATRKEEEARRRTGETVVKTVSLEIEHNLALLAAFHHRVMRQDAYEKIAPLHRFGLFPCPHWSSTMWSQQVSQLTVAFDEAQIVEIERVYHEFANIRDTHDTALKFAQMDRLAGDMAIECFAAFKRSAAMILDLGNPIANRAAEAGRAEAWVEVSRDFAAPVDRVWRAWTDRDALSQWFRLSAADTVYASLDLRAGGQFRIDFGSHASSQQGSGIYREVQPPHRLVFTFRWEGAEEIGTFASVMLSAQPGGTHMTFRHALRESRDREGHIRGWSAAFDRLAASLKSSPAV